METQQEQTKKCPKCKEEIKKDATLCKHCGTKITTREQSIVGIGCLVILIIFIALIWVGSSSNKDSEKTTTNQKQEKELVKEGVEEAKSVPAEYKSALNKATSYSNTMHMSKQGIYNQLVSDYGEQFSAEAAQYAIDNVSADWNANALAKAKNYQSTMNMSPAAIHDQLISEYGEKFTKAEADYAIQHLND